MVRVCALQSMVRMMDAGLQGQRSGCCLLGPMFFSWISLQLGLAMGPGPGSAMNGLLGQIEVLSNTVPGSCTGDSGCLTAALCCLRLTLLWV